MATQFQLRRGTTVQNNAFVGAEGEITVDTEKHALRIHDGVTPGGYTQDFVIESWISDDGLSWYRKYSSGWVEQGGMLSGTSATVTLPIEMANTNYNIFAQWWGGKSASFYSSDQHITNITVTGFTTNGPENANVKQRNWQVTGLGA